MIPRVASVLAAVLLGSVASGPADLILSAEGAVFVARGGESIAVTETPFVLEMGDVVSVGPGGRAVLPGATADEPLVLTATSGPHTVAEARPLIVTMLSAAPVESTQIGGTDFSTMRGAVRLSHRLASPRNTAVLEPPGALTVALPRAAAAEFLERGAEPALRATLTLTALGDESPLLAADLAWTREELQALLDSGEEEDLRRVDFGAVALPRGRRLIAHVAAPELQRLALEDDPAAPPPEDRAWLLVLDEAQRTSCEGDLAQLRAITARLPELGAAELALWETRVLLAHGLSAAAEQALTRSLTALPPGAPAEEVARLRGLHEQLMAQIRRVWAPE